MTSGAHEHAELLELLEAQAARSGQLEAALTEALRLMGEGDSAIIERIEGCAGELAQLRRRVRALEDLVQPPRAPALVGSSAQPNGSSTAWAELIAGVGHDLELRRSYQQAGKWPTDFAHSTAGFDVGARASLWSWKASSDDGFLAWPAVAAGDWDARYLELLRSVPDSHRLLTAFHHEPDGGGKGPNGSDGDPSIFRSCQLRLAQLTQVVNAERVGRGAVPILYGVILTAWNYDTRGAASFDQWVEPSAPLAFVGFDAYCRGAQPPSLATRVAPLMAHIAAMGRPALIGEFGAPETTPEIRAAWLAEAIAWARNPATPIVAAAYWHADNNVLTTAAELAALGG